MFNFLNNIINPPFFGLDVSDLTVKFLKVSRAKTAFNKKIDYFGEIQIPAGLVDGGEIKKERELADILSHELKDERGTTVKEKFVVGSLPEEKSFTRVIQLPKMKAAELAAAVRWEIEANIPLPLDQVYFDYETIVPPLPPTDHLDVLITAFPRPLVDSYASTLRGAGFIPLALEVESQAISRAIVDKSRPDDTVIIIDLGMTRISFIVFGAGAIILTLSTAFGGRDFNQAIAEKAGVSLAEGEKLKKQYGLDRNYRRGIIVDALMPFLAALTEEIRKQIWFYRDHAEHRHGAAKDISRVLLVGGDANLIGMEKFLSVALKKPVITGDPFLNVYGAGYKNVPVIPKNASLQYTTGIGLALRN